MPPAPRRLHVNNYLDPHPYDLAYTRRLAVAGEQIRPDGADPDSGSHEMMFANRTLFQQWVLDQEELVRWCLRAKHQPKVGNDPNDGFQRVATYRCSRAGKYTPVPDHERQRKRDPTTACGCKAGFTLYEQQQTGQCKIVWRWRHSGHSLGDPTGRFLNRAT
ncbi:hypothetical protein ACM66B_000833 [Microbotryomycetes sp. NB124-2]